MIHEGSDLIGKPLYAIDQELGTVADFYFDDRSWKIRYFLIAPNNPANPGDVLVSTDSLASFARERLSVQLTEPEIFNVTGLSREEMLKNNHLFHDQLTGDSDMGGQPEFPMVSSVDQLTRSWPPGRHMRSYLAMLEYTMHSNEAPSANITGVLFDEPSWLLRSIVFALRDQNDHLTRFIDPVFIDSIDPGLKAIYLSCSGTFLRKSPPYDRNQFTNISYKDFLQHYSQAIRH